MELRHLEIFCRIVELKSFSRAAEELCLTQPTISSHIKALEKSLNTQLLDRLGREVTPTKAGALLYKYAKEIVRQKEEAQKALDQFTGRMSGSLDIGGSTIPGTYILPNLIGEFKKDYPDIVVTLRIGDTREVAKMVREGEAEIGIVGARIDDPHMENSRFMTDSMILVAPLSFPHRNIPEKNLSDIPLILREKGSGSREALERMLSSRGIKIEDLHIVAEMGSTEAVKQAVRSGIGLSVLSRRSVHDELEQGLLKIVKTENLSIDRSFYIITDRMRAKSPVCKAFLKLLKSHT